MAKSLSSSSLFKSRSKNSHRQELDVNIFLVLAIAVAITALVYGIFFLFKEDGLNTSIFILPVLLLP